MRLGRAMDEELRCLLHELRVALPGVQMLFAFLLIVPFTERFARVDPIGLGLYGGALASTALASIALVAPSVHHRLYFRRDVAHHDRMLATFNRLAIAGSVCLAFGLVCSLGLLGQFLLGRVGAIVAASVASALCCMLWYGLPMAQRNARPTRRAIASSSYRDVTRDELRSMRQASALARRDSAN